ncbi:MAG: penicillin-binding protein 2 [Gaiellaceae bacterium]
MASTPFRARPRGFLPRDPRVEEPYRLTPQLAFRIGILAALALAAFALLILRLWALQVLSGDEYLRVAHDNQVRRVRLEAERGPILDRNGKTLVANRTVTSVRISPPDLPEKGRYQELRRLARLLGVPLGEILAKVERQKRDPLTPITIKRDVPRGTVYFLLEHQSEFQGVQIADTQVRRYPLGKLASHLLGHVGEITKKQLEELKDYHLGDRVGQRGAEAAFDGVLRGRTGLATLRVDSAGRPRGDFAQTAAPVPGDAVRLTLDVDLQRAAEEAIATGIRLAIDNENWYANGGAAVALDPRTGEVLALASLPAYHPGAYSNPGKRKELRFLLDERAAEEANFPGINRTTEGLYPPGSTWKPVTALAAIQEGLVGPYDQLPCPAVFYVRDSAGNPVLGGEFNNWNDSSSGALTLPQALEQSCDTYFYDLGMRFYSLPGERGHPLQEWASRWGFGRPTGVETGGELGGLLPTPEWRKRTYTKKTLPCCWEQERLWKPGDSIQLAIGQKDLLVTPLQMASFYAMVANNGRMVQPHLLKWAERGTDRTLPLVTRRYSGPAPRESGINPVALSAVQDGLYAATHGAYGTATAVFDGFPVSIAGKTGTAEKRVEQAGGALVDQSWFCGYGPTDATPELAVCVVIENGGFGGEAAAPAALEIFQEYFHRQGGNVAPVPTD